MAFKRISRGEWERELCRYGCRPLEGTTKLNTAEWWRWPWGAYPFTVPVDEDGYCDYWAYQRILADMAGSAPEDWEFPNGDD